MTSAAPVRSEPARRALDQTCVTVLGCGGLGVPAAWTLALGGVKRLRLVDPDVVELANLHRQVAFGQGDLGVPKVDALARWLQSRVPGLVIERVVARVTADSLDGLLWGCEAVVEGTDDTPSKFLVNDWAIRPGPDGRTRVATIAAAIQRKGQLFTVTPHGACYRCLFEEPPPPECVGTCAIAGVMGPAVGQVGAWAARSLLAVLQGQADPAESALLRLDPRGVHRTAVSPAGDCLCAASRLTGGRVHA